MIDILILTHNNIKTLPKCINSIKNNTYNPYKIYILDNASTDKEFIEYLKSIQCRNIKIYFNKKNTGISAGRYFLSEKANNKYIMFLDSDMIVSQAWDKIMIKIFEMPLAGAVGAKFTIENSNIIHANGGFYKIEDEFIIFKHYDKGLWSYDIRSMEIRSCNWLPGGAMMITKEVNNLIKYSNKYYKVGFEDIDFSFTLKRAAYNLYNCPFTDFKHLSNEKSEDYKDIRMNKLELLKSAIIFFKKWKLNPIKSWKLHKFIFGEDINDDELKNIFEKISSTTNDKILEQFIC